MTSICPVGLLDEPAFQPRYETEIKVRGRFIRVEKPMVEGLVICVTADPGVLGKVLADMGLRPGLLGGDGAPTPLSPEEALLLGGLAEPGSRVVPMSLAYKVGKDAVVVSGPLLGYEGLISRIDRRKSTAHPFVDVDGRIVSSRCGIAVVAPPVGWQVDVKAAARARARKAPREAVPA